MLRPYRCSVNRFTTQSERIIEFFYPPSVATTRSPTVCVQYLPLPKFIRFPFVVCTVCSFWRRRVFPAFLRHSHAYFSCSYGGGSTSSSPIYFFRPRFERRSTTRIEPAAYSSYFIVSFRCYDFLCSYIIIAFDVPPCLRIDRFVIKYTVCIGSRMYTYHIVCSYIRCIRN